MDAMGIVNHSKRIMTLEVVRVEKIVQQASTGRIPSIIAVRPIEQCSASCGIVDACPSIRNVIVQRTLRRCMLVK